jgi:hypothetical protein
MIRKLRPSFLFRSFSNRVISSKRLISVIYKLSGHRLLAYLLFFSIEKEKWSKNNPGVLCVKRNLFDKDIKELRKYAKNLNWLVIGTTQLTNIQNAWTPGKIHGQTVFQKYFTKEYENKWEECKLFAELFLKIAIKRLNIKAVLSANIDYWQDEGLRRACKAISISFLSLAKENYIIPSFIEDLTEYYRGLNFKFTGDGVAVFSNSMKDFLIKSEICEAKKIHVTGAPRLDAWKRISGGQYVQDSIVLLPYGKDYGLKSELHFMEMLNLFLSFAKKYSDSHLNFVIKCKNQRYKSELHNKLTKADLEFIKLTVDQPLYELYPRSRLVIGYNTLALLEALLSKTVIAIPQWGEIGNDTKSQQFNPEDESCSSVIEFVQSIFDMEKLLKKIIEKQDYNFDMEKRISLMQNYMFYDPNKFNSKYVEEFVLSYIN